jgi:hypothetical protein
MDIEMENLELIYKWWIPNILTYWRIEGEGKKL